MHPPLPFYPYLSTFIQPSTSHLHSLDRTHHNSPYPSASSTYTPYTPITFHTHNEAFPDSISINATTHTRPLSPTQNPNPLSHNSQVPNSQEQNARSYYSNHSAWELIIIQRIQYSSRIQARYCVVSNKESSLFPRSVTLQTVFV